MLRTLRNAARALALVAAVALLAPLEGAATVYTQAVAVTSAAWVNLGAGPIAVGTNSYVGAWIVASDSAPNTSPNIAGFGTVLSQNVGPTPPIQTFCGTTNYWALAIGGSPSNPASTTLNVTPTNCGGAGSQTVTGNVGGYDSGTSPAQTATPANASHPAGQSVGGLFSVPLARANGGGGQLEQITFMSVGGDTPTLLVRVWDRKPTSGSFACADNAAYVAGSTTDDSHLLTPPFTVTLVAPTTATGDAKTYGYAVFSPPLSFKNQDSATTQDLYVCALATSTFTPAAAAYIVNTMGAQD